MKRAGSTSVSPLPLSFSLSQELFYFDSCCHHQGKSPSPRAGEGEKMREVLSLFSSQLKVNIIFLLVFLSTTETGWHIQHEIYQTLRKTQTEIKKIRRAQNRWLIPRLLTREGVPEDQLLSYSPSQRLPCVGSSFHHEEEITQSNPQSQLTNFVGFFH